LFIVLIISYFRRLVKIHGKFFTGSRTQSAWKKCTKIMPENLYSGQEKVKENIEKIKNF